MIVKNTYQPTEFDYQMLEILEEQVERKARTNYERFQLEKYGNVLDAGEEEDLENSFTDRDRDEKYVETMRELQLMENDTSDIETM